MPSTQSPPAPLLYNSHTSAGVAVVLVVRNEEVLALHRQVRSKATRLTARRRNDELRLGERVGLDIVVVDEDGALIIELRRAHDDLFAILGGENVATEVAIGT